MLRADRVDATLAMLLVIDMQTRLLPSIRQHTQVAAACGRLIDMAKLFRLPIIATEQYVKGLGATELSLAAKLAEAGAKVLEKPSFSCCGEEPIREALRQLDRRQVVVTGVECHVCVQQTVLDLLAMDYDVFVCADACGSRSGFDMEIALQRMRDAGALVTTTESVMFELCERCDGPAFKEMLAIVKQRIIEPNE